MRKLSPSGFAAVETLLIVVILAIVAGTGYFVWHAKQMTDSTLDAAQKSAASQRAVAKSGGGLTNSSSSRAANTPPAPITTTFSKLPGNLQTAIINHIKQHSPKCLNANNQQLDEAGQPTDPDAIYFQNAYAKVGECTSEAIYSYHDNNWYFVEQTKFGFDCVALEQNNIPASVIAINGKSTCIDESNNQVTYPRS